MRVTGASYLIYIEICMRLWILAGPYITTWHALYIKTDRSILQYDLLLSKEHTSLTKPVYPTNCASRKNLRGHILIQGTSFRRIHRCLKCN